MTASRRSAEVFDRRVLLRRGAGLAVALAGWQLVGDASAAADPRLKALQKLVKGPVLVPPTAAYQQARVLYQQRFDNVYPLGVVQPLSAADISQIVLWAKKAKVKLAIRGGGHSYAGYSTGTGLVVDLRRMSSVSLNSTVGDRHDRRRRPPDRRRGEARACRPRDPERLVRVRRDRRARARRRPRVQLAEVRPDERQRHLARDRHGRRPLPPLQRARRTPTCSGPAAAAAAGTSGS